MDEIAVSRCGRECNCLADKVESTQVEKDKEIYAKDAQVRAGLVWITVGLLGMAVGYGILVTPKRFVQCLPGLAAYFRRDDRVATEAALPGFVPGNQARLLVNGNETLPVMLEMIHGAKESIRWQVMLFKPDAVGQELAGALAQAAQRGVQVQVSFDINQSVNGSIADSYPRHKKLEQNGAMQQILSEWNRAGVTVLENPPGVDFPLEGVSAEAAAIQRNIAQASCVNANHYDHRKILIVDDRLAMIGGMNVGREYLYRIPVNLHEDAALAVEKRKRENLPEAWEKWQDVMVQLEGPVVEVLIKEFNWRWEVLGGRPLAEKPLASITNGAAVQLLRQRPGVGEISTAYFDLIENAASEIYVASPFVSYDPVLQALVAARKRGVRVVFVYPDRHNPVEVSRRIFARRANALAQAGIELIFNSTHMAHTKMMVVDGQKTLIGSFNLNYRSFLHDLEAVVVIDDPVFAQEALSRVFIPYLENGIHVNEFMDTPWNPLNWFIQPFT